MAGLGDSLQEWVYKRKRARARTFSPSAAILPAGSLCTARLSAAQESDLITSTETETETG